MAPVKLRPFWRRNVQPAREDPRDDTPIPPEIAAMLSLVEPMERAVLVTRFGLDIGQPRTIEDTAEVLGWSVAEVEKLEASAVARLRAARGE